MTRELSQQQQRKAARIGASAALVARAICAALRFQIEDRAGILSRDLPPTIWAFWHNRLLVVPHVFSRIVKTRRGAALTSASKDGEILAQFISRFGIRPVRGSSSRRGAAALIEMMRLMREGFDIAITPDGPRGPRYVLSPGILTLAQKTGAPILPVQIEYSRFFALKSWDAFQIPLPLSRVRITFDELIRVNATTNESEFEVERARIENALHA